jgi:hypothetical protein
MNALMGFRGAFGEGEGFVGRDKVSNVCKT